MPHPFTAHVPTRWVDLDVLNHINNAVYLTYVEQARTEWLDSVPGAWSPERGPVVAELRCAYRTPIRHPATVVVRLQVTRAGRSSLTVRHELSVVGDEETVYAEGETVMVWIDFGSGRPVALPDAVREAAREPAAALPPAEPS